MLISELQSLLDKIKAEHGDIICVTPGFDEIGFDDIGEKLEITQIELPENKSLSCFYKYIESKDTCGNSVRALVINW